MLEKTFLHIPGLSLEDEQSLWDQGCRSWFDAIEGIDSFSLPSVETKKLVSAVKRSIRAKASGEHQFFGRKLGIKHSWRAYPDFKDSCVFLDIETDGRNRGEGITMIGLYDGTTFQALVKGEDLGNFPDVISRYSMIVTFCGAGFDLPIIQKRFPLHKLDQIHIDLHPMLRSLGHSGGLKKIEKDLGISRSSTTEGLTGFDAVKLWRRYLNLRDESALERLIAYNREDVVNLQALTEYAYGKLAAQTFPSETVTRPGRLFEG